MDSVSDILIHRMASNYLRCLADFQAELTPQCIDAPVGQQEVIYNGLHELHALIRSIYQYFASLPVNPQDLGKWAEDEYCWKTIEDPVKSIWALGVTGQLVSSPGGAELQASKASLDSALKSRASKPAPRALDVLEAVGFQVSYRDGQGQSIPGGYKGCTTIAVSAPAGCEAVLEALQYTSARFPVVKNGIPFEVFLRADFRPLLPGYQAIAPHIPLTEDEIFATLDPSLRETWLELVHYPDQKYPRLGHYYRVPRLRFRTFGIDFSPTGKDYGLWTIYSEEKGVRFRVVIKQKGYHYLLDHIDTLSPRYQEIYLNHIPCTDCIRCGKEIYYQHGDHVHRICKGPWYYSPPIQPEDLPDIKRLIDIHMSHLK